MSLASNTNTNITPQIKMNDLMDDLLNFKDYVLEQSVQWGHLDCTQKVDYIRTYIEEELNCEHQFNLKLGGVLSVKNLNTQCEIFIDLSCLNETTNQISKLLKASFAPKAI